MKLRIKDFSMDYTDVGTGFPILFIHGHPFNRDMWEPQINALRWQFRVIAPDLRGYGKSETGSDPIVTQEMFASDLANLLDQLSVPRVCVVGLSMGGQIAMEFARAYPDRTAALVLSATSAAKETEAGVVERNRVADRILQDGIVPVGSEMLCKLLAPKTLKNRPELAARVFHMICRADSIGASAAVRGRAMRQDYRLSLSNFDGPSMVVVGTEDTYTPVSDAEEISGLMKNCQLEVFNDIGHLPNLEDEDRFNRCLHSFLQRVPFAIL